MPLSCVKPRSVIMPNSRRRRERSESSSSSSSASSSGSSSSSSSSLSSSSASDNAAIPPRSGRRTKDATIRAPAGKEQSVSDREEENGERQDGDKKTNHRKDGEGEHERKNKKGNRKRDGVEDRDGRDRKRRRQSRSRSRSRSGSRNRTNDYERDKKTKRRGDRGDRGDERKLEKKRDPQKDVEMREGKNKDDSADGGSMRSKNDPDKATKEISRNRVGGKGGSSEKAEAKSAPAARANILVDQPATVTGRTGGVYIPPFKLAQMQKEAAVMGKATKEYQRMAWEALRKSINGLINKVSLLVEISQHSPEGLH